MTGRGLRRLASAATMAAVIGTGSAAADLIDRVLAIVDGQIVTLSDAHAALALGLVAADDNADPIAAALAALIERRLVTAEVDRYAVREPDEAALDRRVAALLDALAAHRGERPLAELGLSDRSVRALARDDLRLQIYLERRFGTVQPTDAEVEAYYRDHPDRFMRAGVQLPFVEARADARQRLVDQRRQQLIDEWIAYLRRRADITVLYLPGS